MLRIFASVSLLCRINYSTVLFNFHVIALFHLTTYINSSIDGPASSSVSSAFSNIFFAASSVMVVTVLVIPGNEHLLVLMISYDMS